jgi:hypothetical protein
LALFTLSLSPVDFGKLIGGNVIRAANIKAE